MLLAIAASIPSTAPWPAAATPATEFRATLLSIGDGDTLRVSRQGLPITKETRDLTITAAKYRSGSAVAPPSRQASRLSRQTPGAHAPGVVVAG